MIAELAGPGDDNIRNGSGSLEVRLPGGAVARAVDSAQVQLLARLLRHLA